MNVFANLMNWDPVALLSVLMVILCVVIVVFLVRKVRELMRRDAAAHGDERS